VSRGLNKVQLIGNLGVDPDTRYMPSGAAMTKLSVGVTDTWKDKQTGEQKERTEWVTVEVWGRLAEVCSEYLEKGRSVYVEGSMQTDKWEKDGETKYFTKVRASDVLFLGGGGNRNQRAGDARDQDGKPPAGSNIPGPKDFDDDIPF